MVGTPSQAIAEPAHNPTEDCDCCPHHAGSDDIWCLALSINDQRQWLVRPVCGTRRWRAGQAVWGGTHTDHAVCKSNGWIAIATGSSAKTGHNEHILDVGAT